MRYKNKATIKQNWLRAFEVRVCEINPKHSGKICWDTAIYLFNTGATVTEAANKYTESK